MNQPTDDSYDPQQHVRSLADVFKAKEESGDLELKGRGAKRSVVSTPAQVDPPTVQLSSETLIPLVKAVGNATCRIASVEVLEETEVKEIADALAPVADKYLGTVAQEWGAEVVLLFVVLKVTAPRVINKASEKEGEEDHGKVPDNFPDAAKTDLDRRETF